MEQQHRAAATRRLGVVSAGLAACLTVAAAGAAAARHAQVQPPAVTIGTDARTETRHLTITTSTAARTAAPGARVLLHVDVSLKPGMHVYAPDQQQYLPIALALTPTPAYRAETPRFPKSEPFFFEPLNESQRVYSRAFRITQPIVINRAGSASSLTIDGAVRYQACDDSICYLPQTVPVRWKISIERRP